MKKDDIIAWIFIVVILLFFVMVALMIMRIPTSMYDNDKVCIKKYGSNWRYDNSQVFGDLCVYPMHENLTILKRKDFPEYEEIKKICDIPDLFELSKWSNICENDTN